MIIFALISLFIFIGCVLGFSLIWSAILFTVKEFIGISENVSVPLLFFAFLTSVIFYFIISTSFIYKLKPRVSKSQAWVIAAIPPILTFSIAVYILEQLYA